MRLMSEAKRLTSAQEEGGGRGCVHSVYIL